MTFPIDSTYTDGNGKQVLLSSDIQAIEAVDLLGSDFWSPSASFTGFAANGNPYVAGEAQSGDRATWATEDDGTHRGTLNRFPQMFFIVLTDIELSIIAADTFDLFIRFILGGTGTGAALGATGDTLVDVAWEDGRVVVATDNHTRVFDFREDRIYAFTEAEHYRASSVGIENRNSTTYFGATGYSPGGPEVGTSVATFMSGTSAYYIVGSQVGVTVFKWSANGIGSLTTRATALGGESRGQQVASSGDLYILIEYDDGGTDTLKVVRSISEWQALGSGFSGSVHQLDLPTWPGVEGSLVVHGDYVYVGVGSGVWATDRYSLTLFNLLYGKTLLASEPVSPQYEILPVTNDPVTTIHIDNTTRNLAVLYKSSLAIIHLGDNVVVSSYSTGADSSPQLPSPSRALASYSFEVGEI